MKSSSRLCRAHRTTHINNFVNIEKRFRFEYNLYLQKFAFLYYFVKLTDDSYKLLKPSVPAIGIRLKKKKKKEICDRSFVMHNMTMLTLET